MSALIPNAVFIVLKHFMRVLPSLVSLRHIAYCHLQVFCPMSQLLKLLSLFWLLVLISVALVFDTFFKYLLEIFVHREMVCLCFIVALETCHFIRSQCHNLSFTFCFLWSYPLCPKKDLWRAHAYIDGFEHSYSLVTQANWSERNILLSLVVPSTCLQFCTLCNSSGALVSLIHCRFRKHMKHWGLEIYIQLMAQGKWYDKVILSDTLACVSPISSSDVPHHLLSSRSETLWKYKISIVFCILLYKPLEFSFLSYPKSLFVSATYW